MGSPLPLPPKVKPNSTVTITGHTKVKNRPSAMRGSNRRSFKRERDDLGMGVSSVPQVRPVRRRNTCSSVGVHLELAHRARCAATGD